MPRYKGGDLAQRTGQAYAIAGGDQRQVVLCGRMMHIGVGRQENAMSEEDPFGLIDEAPTHLDHAVAVVARSAGLDPSFVQSGEEFRRGRISKNGNTLLRTVLVEVALGMARRDDGPLGRFYRRKKAQIGHHKAIIALARKLLIVAWRMLLTGEV